MKPVRTWTVPGEPSLTITIHRPAMTLRMGDGPEVTLNPDQVAAMSERFADAECYFDGGAPDLLD